MSGVIREGDVGRLPKLYLEIPALHMCSYIICSVVVQRTIRCRRRLNDTCSSESQVLKRSTVVLHVCVGRDNRVLSQVFRSVPSNCGIIRGSSLFLLLVLTASVCQSLCFGMHTILPITSKDVSKQTCRNHVLTHPLSQLCRDQDEE